MMQPTAATPVRHNTPSTALQDFFKVFLHIPVGDISIIDPKASGFGEVALGIATIHGAKQQALLFPDDDALAFFGKPVDQGTDLFADHPGRQIAGLLAGFARFFIHRFGQSFQGCSMTYPSYYPELRNNTYQKFRKDSQNL
ncbi:hypothetical protein [Aquitalea denitrificans]|uniref:hypothetical protein n=1 Tax=Aquitalea denitrificans TaxID=519081 RepID=UPI0013599FB0|nr:hypothetical protein [Aquitalea denitrificans]